MSESLSEDELAELIRGGRINASRSASKRREKMTRSKSEKNDKNRPRSEALTSVPRASDSSPQGAREVTKTASGKEPDPEWLRAEKEKADRNIATPRQDKRRREEMQEASKF